MTIHELVTVLKTMEPEHDVFVTLHVDDTAELFDIEGVGDHHGYAELEIYAEEEGTDAEPGNGAVRGEEAEGRSDAADAAIEAFLDLCERRGITQEEKDLIWNAMAMLCYEQVQSRQGPFYEAIKPLFTEGDA